jgi:protein gp37
MLGSLDRIGYSYRRQVAILQPRVWRGDLDDARAARRSDDARRPPAVQRLLQLETLLVGVESNCNSLGANLIVLGDGTAAAAPSL